MASWYYPTNDHGENKGINDSGVALFRGTPLKSLAREICQNSLDAAEAESIRVEFRAFSVPTSSLPGCSVMKDTFERCTYFWGHQKAKTTKEFFANAIDKISADRINMLRISDFQTSGLMGSKEELNTDWTNLTKSSGVSDKSGTAGGSFGIGKFAPFACSDFSMVFYSTFDKEGVKASQGVSRLVTFRREDGETTQGIGYYGNEKNTPVYEVLDLDSSFTRKSGEYGTDIYIAGYKYAGDDWEDNIVISVLDGFLGALWNSKLVVKVGDIEISKETLPELIETYRDALTGYVDKYYEVLTSSKTKWFEEDFMKMGTVKLGLLIEKDMHRKVAMIRQTGMKIMDRDRLSGYIPFAGVMFIEGEKINRVLRQIENPEHTEWQPDRAAHPAVAKQIVKSLNDYMKECIEKLAAEGAQDEMDAVGVGALIPDIPESEEEQAKEETISDKVADIEKTVVKRRPQSGKEEGQPESEADDKGGYTEGDSDVGWPHNGEGGKHPGPRPPDQGEITDEGKERVPSLKEIKPEKVIVVCVDKNSGKYMLLFVPSVEGTAGFLSVELSAETQNYEAPLLEAKTIGGKDLSVENGKIAGLDFNKGAPIRLNIHLDYSDYCSMEVKAYAHKA